MKIKAFTMIWLSLIIKLLKLNILVLTIKEIWSSNKSKPKLSHLLPSSIRAIKNGNQFKPNLCPLLSTHPRKTRTTTEHANGQNRLEDDQHC